MNTNTEREEPSYLAFARANVCDGRDSNASIVRRLLARVDALEDAAKPRTITTVEELDTLPEGSVVLSKDYVHHTSGMRIAFQKWDSGFWHRGGRSGHTHPDYFLPATVLFTPEPTK